MLKEKQNGFTVVELLITIVIFAVSVPAIASIITLIDGINDRSRDMAQINGLVENKIEGLRSVSFVGLTNGTTDFTTSLASSIASPRSATYTISSLSTAVKQIDVTVTYNDHGTTRTLSYRTYIGELGVGQY